MSGLPPLRGHHEVRGALLRSLALAKLAPSILITGPQGIGKQRLGLWLGQCLLCEDRQAEGPCDRCRPCRLVRRLEHPDLHWFFPLPRPRVSGGSDRLGEALEDARASELQARRETPHYATTSDEPVGIYLAHARVIRRLAASRPAMASHQVFVIGDAESLVPQEASPESANALLKLLEEPPPGTTLVLTASEPDALLPTVRSRLQAVRLDPLPVADVAAFLKDVMELADADAESIARLAMGSIGRALGFLPVEGQPGPLEALRQRSKALLDAALEPAAARRFELALEQPPAGARGDYATLLEFLSVWLRDLAATATGVGEAVVNVDAREWLEARAASIPEAAAGAARAIVDVEEALRLTRLNINPQLALLDVLAAVHARLDPDTRTLAAAPPGR